MRAVVVCLRQGQAASCRGAGAARSAGARNRGGKAERRKAKRKKAGDGIETAIFTVLREVYDVRIQAYHGGSLTGKDIQKVMVDSDDIFQIIAGILKEQKKEAPMRSSLSSLLGFKPSANIQ